MQSKVVSFVLSVFFVTFVGCFQCRAGIGIAIFSSALIAILVVKLRESGGWSGFADWENSAFALGLAVLPAVATNDLVLTVSGLTLAAYLLLLVLRCGAPRCRISLATLPGLLVAFGVHVIAGITEGIMNTFALRNIRVGRKLAIGILLSFIPLAIFHPLLAAANDAYKTTIENIIDIIFNKLVIERTLQVWTHYLFLQAVLTFSLEESDYPREESKREAVVTISILPALVLIGIFSLFQGTAVANTLDIQTFKELSLYVQQGFWQLLIAALFGFAFWLLVFRRGADVSKAITVPQVLATFALLVLCISLFTGHKVAVLQWSFGFKDQRIYATLAVLLLSLGSVLGFLLARGLVTSVQSCRLMTTVALATVGALGWINIDLLAAKTNPIRFYINEKPVRDLSYLLGNSFDNVSAWEDLMSEGISSGIKAPPKYYWGKFLPLCQRDYEGSAVVYLEKRNQDLIEEYSSEVTSLRQLGGYNIREWHAYHWLLSHRDLTEQFYAAAHSSC